MEGIEHGHSQMTRGLKNMVVTLCDTSSFHLSSRDCEPLCEAFQAQKVFVFFLSVLRAVGPATRGFPAFLVVPLQLLLPLKSISGTLTGIVLLKILILGLTISLYWNQLLPLGHQVSGKVSYLLMLPKAVHCFPYPSLHKNVYCDR